MAQPLSIVVTQPWNVRQELRSLGLTVDIVKDIARQAAAARAEALPIDPCSAPGTFAYIRGVRAIRLALIPTGWRMSRAGNVESTVNDDLGIQLVFQNVDMACGSREPQAISEKGAGSRKLIEFGRQGELFERHDIPAAESLGVVPTVWLVCVSVDGQKLRAEVSCPNTFEGSQFEGFSKRIFVVDEDLGPDSHKDSSSDDEDDDGDFEVLIAKK